jgi:1-aminocyclopropane-1-carboxylate deaminase/D-cysteine desulfhydrase-like pyridoxal-dependent ACC family enzyme
MMPGGATPLGALAYIAAAFELAHQVRALGIEPPRAVYIGVGSTCTSAGLLAGFALASRLGIGFRSPPKLVSVRVTPWPVTASFRIVGLARRALRLLAALAKEPGLELDARGLSANLELEGRFLGAGYGRATRSGERAIELGSAAGLPGLDPMYSGKALAGFIDALESSSRAVGEKTGGPLVFWSTKSSAPLPDVSPDFEKPTLSRALRFIEQAGEMQQRSPP